MGRTMAGARGGRLLVLLAVLALGPAAAAEAQDGAPVACFSQSPASPQTGQTVTFDSSCSSGRINSRRWDLDNDGAFDDGSGTTASRSFAVAGSYTVRLRVGDDRGRSDIESRTVTVANRGPAAAFSFSPANPTTGQTVTFTSSSTDPDGTVASQAWDLDNDGAFDDGVAATATRSFATPGTFTVRLRVTDNNGASATTSRTVTASNRGPTAAFTFSPTAPATGQAVTFTSTATDPDGTIAARAWDLDNDGSFDDGTGATATRTYATTGTFTVRLRVTDNNGAAATTSRSVVVSNRPPVAAFTLAPAEPVAGDTVTLTSASTDGDGAIASYAWDLNGDGAYDDATGATAAWTPPTAGSYVVGLRVVDDRGAADVEQGTVVVRDAIPAATTPGQPFDTITPAPPVEQPVAPVAPLQWLDPFPLVRIRGRTTRRGAQIALFTVTAPEGAAIAIHCKGRNCPSKPQRATVKVRPGKTSRTIRFRRLQRFLPAGVELRVTIKKDGMVGKYTRFKIRRVALPIRSDRCLVPGSRKPQACPGR